MRSNLVEKCLQSQFSTAAFLSICKQYDFYIFSLVYSLFMINRVKIGGLRFIEFFFGAFIGLYLISYLFSSKQKISEYTWKYFGMVLICFILSILSYGQEIYYDLSLVGPLKQPLALIVSRTVQMILCWGFVMYFISRNPDLTSFCRHLSFYVNAVTTISVVYIIGWLLHTFNIYSWGWVMYASYRLKGGFQEGGSYGLFLSSVVGVILLLRYFGIKKTVHLFILLAALLMTDGKSGMLSVVCIFSLYYIFIVFNRLSRFKKIVTVTIISIAMFFFLSFIAKKTSHYYHNITKMELAIQRLGNSGALVLGRMAAAYILPQMFLDNWLIGVGLGHYSLMRNNPKYLGPIPHTTEWDLSGMGYFTMFAEVGIIGTVAFTAFYLLIYFRMRKHAELRPIVWIIFVPLVCQALGVQYYFFYHWIFVGCGICLLKFSSQRGLATLVISPPFSSKVLGPIANPTKNPL